MAFLYDTALDAALASVITSGTHLSICSAEPANYAGIAAVELGKAAVTIGAVSDGATSGRRVTVPAVSGASVTANGDLAAWALHDNTGVLVASGTATTQTMTAGNSYDTNAFDITIPDAA